MSCCRAARRCSWKTIAAQQAVPAAAHPIRLQTIDLFDVAEQTKVLDVESGSFVKLKKFTEGDNPATQVWGRGTFNARRQLKVNNVDGTGRPVELAWQPVGSKDLIKTLIATKGIFAMWRVSQTPDGVCGT